MNVDIISMTPKPLRVLWTATRTCKSGKTPQELWEESASEGDEDKSQKQLKLIDNIIKSGHMSVLEHVSITYAIEGISRSCLAQLTRHRHLSFCVQSQRAVDAKNFHYALPEEINNGVWSPRINQHLHDVQELYKDLVSEGIKKEDARLFLPECTTTNLVLTCNLRSLFELWKKRANNPAAQDEIRILVQEMAKRLIEKEEWLGKYFKVTE